MPTYEYRCPQGHDFEVLQRISDEPGADCPECGEPGERKISGGAGFLFKGDGFYITDYRSDEYKKKASSEAAPASSAGSGETKEATKSDTPAKPASTDSSSSS
jgi:putative FmdB family regulatory protein